MSEYIEFKDRFCTPFVLCLLCDGMYRTYSFVFHYNRLVLNFYIFYSVSARHVCVFCTPVSEIFDVKQLEKHYFSPRKPFKCGHPRNVVLVQYNHHVLNIVSYIEVDQTTTTHFCYISINGFVRVELIFFLSDFRK